MCSILLLKKKYILILVLKMATIALMVGGAITNALAFSGSNFLFSQMSGAEERKRHNLAMENLQHERDTWNEERLERIDYINEELKKRGHAAKTFQNVDQAMQQYYFLTGTELPSLSSEPQLEDFLDDDQRLAIQRGELTLITIGILTTAYLTYKFI